MVNLTKVVVTALVNYAIQVVISTSDNIVLLSKMAMERLFTSTDQLMKAVGKTIERAKKVACSIMFPETFTMETIQKERGMAEEECITLQLKRSTMVTGKTIEGKVKATS